MQSSAQQLSLMVVELIAVCGCVLAIASPRFALVFLRAAVIAGGASIIYRYGSDFASEAITSFRTSMHYPPPFLYWAIFAIPAGCILFFVVTCFTPTHARGTGVAVFLLLSVFSVWFAYHAGLGGMLLWNLSAPFSLLPVFLAWALHQERRSYLAREKA